MREREAGVICRDLDAECRRKALLKPHFSDLRVVFESCLAARKGTSE